MTTPNLGETPNSELRDAVHIPVVSVTAAEALKPGDSVRHEHGYAWAVPPGEGDGIVDPFLKGGLKPGAKFWLFMRKINGQPRHSWVAPGFPDEVEKAYESGMGEGQCCYGGG